MSRIKLLDPDVRNKIAAGEVIERPASVAKELLENSIDAGSTDISLEIRYGGKRLLRVSDNGIGMDKDDLLLAFQRHATSKLVQETDLYSISTLGFRGEALPAIASVSKVTVKTGIRGAGAGSSLEMIGSDMKGVRESPPYEGTSIEVRDLFFNTPARKKFLKATNTELYHVLDTATRIALSHWEIRFRVINNEQETMNLPTASGLKERLIQVYGNEFYEELSEVQGQQEDISLHAFVSNHHNYRKTKSSQFIFINRRPIKDPSISRAVYQAYEGLLPQDRHPVFFIYIELNPRTVDVNVHPTKREVRFADRESIFRFVSNSLREVIKGERAEYVQQFTKPSEHSSPAQSFGGGDPSRPFPPVPGKTVVSENLELAYKPSLPFLFLGDTFVALSGKGGLTVIDHHAAHERILFEKFLKGMGSASRQLLFPKPVKLPAKEYSVLLHNKGILLDLGIEIDDFGDNTVLLRSLPDELDNADMDSILSDISTGIIDGTVSRKSLKEDLAALIACHSSIRGKEILNQEKMAYLVDELEKTDNPDQCPHGRPTRIFYSLDDLNRLFKRS
jgi:DNA mismatch repair protein MutL